MKELLRKLAIGERLSEAEMESAILSTMQDGAEAPRDSEIAEFLTLLAKREVSVDELVGATKALRAKMRRVQVTDAKAIDTCGTGGSGYDTFNTSTLSAFVLAASGVTVCKHGNRAATSRCGSADLLEALGYNLELDLEKIPELLAQTSFCFFFAPKHHPATKRVASVRRELGFRTIFNFLGPLSNPAGAGYQVLGVSSESMQEVMAKALMRLGTKRALIVRGEEGLDEISLSSRTKIFEIKNQELFSYFISPEEFSFKRVILSEVAGRGREEAVVLARDLLAGKVSGSYADLVCLNAGSAFYLLDKVSTIAEGVSLAQNILASGKALAVLEKVCELSHSL